MLFSNKSLIIGLSAAILGFSSCSKDKGDSTSTTSTEKTFSFLAYAGTPAVGYIVQTGSLTEGTLTTTGNGVATTYGIIDVKDGYYYAIDYSSTSLVKFTSNNKANTIVKEIPFNKISWAGYSGFFAWKDDKTLVLFNCNAGLQFEYAILNVETMTFTASGNINIPVPTGGDTYWGNSVTFVGNKLYISYGKELATTSSTDNKAYVATIDYPAMTNVTVSTDTRFNYPSPYNLAVPGALTYNGSAYFLTSPTLWAGGGVGSPCGIYRVLNGGTQIDPDYFYELTDRTKEETIGLFNLGNGKAIVKMVDKTLLQTTLDYGTVNAANYYVVDLVAKTKTRIDIPVSRSGAYNKNILVDDGKAYILTNAGDGYYVYEYNIATGAVKKGLKIDGVVAVNRIERVK